MRNAAHDVSEQLHGVQ